MTSPAAWSHRYLLAPAVVSRLMAVEANRALFAAAPFPSAVASSLRDDARLRSTHHSTRIEGNRLTLAETGRAVSRPAGRFTGRERDAREVRNYFSALLAVEAWAKERRPFTEDVVRKIHAVVERGERARPTPYRDGQNVIRDSSSGAIVYLPPEHRDVPQLMGALVRWVREATATGVPFPVVAGLAHYQLATIHPFYDGNGRTARLVATFLLKRGGFGLDGIYSLEEEHARDLPAYYRALATHPHHNYYEGRETADLSGWVAYFVGTLDRAVASAVERARAEGGGKDAVVGLGTGVADVRLRAVLGLFARTDRITSADVASLLGVSGRTARLLCSRWMADGVLVPTSEARKNRAYRRGSPF